MPRASGFMMLRVVVISRCSWCCCGSLPAIRSRPADATGPAIRYSFSGMLGADLESSFRPLGFNWQICVALVPGLAAREVMVGALGTVYSLSGSGGADVANALRPMLRQILIALIVLGAAGCVVWPFLPMSRRQRLFDWLATPGCSNCAGRDTNNTAQ